MLPRWFERTALLLLLVLAVYFRFAQASTVPFGFSDEELTHLGVMRQIEGGTIQVFFAVNPSGGYESLYHQLNVALTTVVGDGLLGFRLLGIFAGCLGLVFLYRATRELFGRGVALTTLGVGVTNIWSVLLARSVTPASLSLVFISATLACMVWTFQLNKPIAPVPPRTLRYTTLGFLIGAAIYTHYSGVLLLLILSLFVLYLWQTQQPVSRQVWSSSLFTIILVVIVSLPYIISVARHPSLTSWQTFWENHPTDGLNFGETLVKHTLGIGLAGDSDPSHNVPGLPLISPFWFVLVVLGLIFVVQRRREPAYGLVLIFFGVGCIPPLWTRNSPDFSTMLLLYPSLLILTGLGAYYAAQYLQRSGWRGGWQFVAILTGLVFIWTAYQTQTHLLTTWADREDTQIAYHSNIAQLTSYLDRSPDDRPTLFCVTNLENRLLADGTLHWSEAQVAEDMLHREDLNRRYAVCRSAMVLIDGGESMRVAVVDPRSLNEAPASIRQWLDQLQPLSVPSLSEQVVFELQAENQLAQIAGQFQLESHLIYPRVTSQIESIKLPVRFGRNVTLLGYVPPATAVYHPNDAITLTMYWRVDGEPPNRLGFFTRLHDFPQSSPYTETNVLDVIPTDLQDRDVIIQAHFLIIPPSLLAGDYLLTLGAYDNNPLNQISVFDAQGEQVKGTYVLVDPKLTIEATP